MAGWKRRSVLTTGGALATGGLLAPVGTSRADEHASEPPLSDSNDWSSYHGNPGNTAYVATDEPLSAPEAVAWQYDEEGDIAVFDGTVYLRTETQVHALDDETGEVQWVADGIDADGTPAVFEDTVFVGGGQLTALEASSGDVRWEAEYEDEVTVPSPTVAFETVYVPVDGTLYAYDADSGSLSWDRSSVDVETNDGDESVTFGPTPVAVANELVYAEIGEAGFVALDATTGTTEWTYWWSYSNDPHGYLVATADRLYTGQIADGAEFPVLDPRTGERITYSSYRFPLAATDDIRVKTDRHSVRASNYDTDENWSVGGATDEWGRPIIVGDTVVVPSHSMADEPAIFGFDLEDGSQRWALRLTGIDINTLDGMTWPSESYVATEDTIYITSPSQLAAIRPSPEADEQEEDSEADEGDEDDADEDEVESEDFAEDGDGENGSDEDDSTNESTDDEDGVSELEEADNSENASSTEATNDSADDSENASGTDGENEDGNESGDGSTNGSQNDSAGGSQNESADGAANESDDDSTPGFTTGVGIVSGALGLEWLRRRTTAAEPTRSEEAVDGPEN